MLFLLVWASALGGDILTLRNISIDCNAIIERMPPRVDALNISQVPDLDAMFFELFGRAHARLKKRYKDDFKDTSDSGYMMFRWRHGYPTWDVPLEFNRRSSAVVLLGLHALNSQLVFPRQNKRKKLACGVMVIFPNSYTHPVRFVGPEEIYFVSTQFIN